MVALLAWAAGAARAEELRLSLPRAVIVKGAQPAGDLNMRAYGQVFDSVSIGWKTVDANELARLDPAPGLVLVIPGRSVPSLSDHHQRRVLELVERGATLVTEGVTLLSEKFGFRAGPATEVAQLEELAYPDVMIVWERSGGVTALQPPAGATVLTREKWTGAPMATVFPHGRGQCLVLATELDPLRGEGYARFPYFVHALQRAGVTLPFRSERLWALFDYSYRTAVDLDYLARRWRAAGIQALHVSAWHFWERDAQRDEYLRRLIAACHRNGVLVYAWLELPHVSARFWQEHPEWRERTAIGQDAHLDWRQLMNLKDPDCFRAVAAGLQGLLENFAWDGVNLSELYFESPQGPQNPQRFTPFNNIVRAEFRARHRLDPVELFRESSPHYWKKDAAAWKKFAAYRVEQVRVLTERFLGVLSTLRKSKPHLTSVVTFVDNLYDPKMRDAIGADVREMLPLLERYDFTLVMEDPGTVWHLGPRRYDDLAQSYGRLTRQTGRLGIDINVVERWQDVYPTRKQTGVEFLELFHFAGKNFPAVLVYFEKSVLNQDLELVANALAAGIEAEAVPAGVRFRSPGAFVFQSGLGAAEYVLDGKPWPCARDGAAYLPAGEHVLAARPAGNAPRVIHFNGELTGAGYPEEGVIELSYSARSRAIALFDRAFSSIAVDGRALALPSGEFALLPHGRHRARIDFR